MSNMFDDAHISPQLLVKEGGRELIFLLKTDGFSCLNVAAHKGCMTVVEVRVIGCV